MKEEVASDAVPSSSQTEPPAKRIKVKIEKNPYRTNNSGAMKTQFAKVQLKQEPIEEYDEYEEEVYSSEYKTERHRYDEEDEESEEEESDVEYLDDNFDEPKEDVVPVVDPNFAGPSDSSIPFADENSTLNSIHWSTDPPSSRPDFTFSGRSGFVELPIGAEPHHFFNLLFTDEFFQLLAEETNAFAEELFLRRVRNPKSRMARWKNTTVAEMRTFLGLHFHMGIIKLNRLSDYWNGNEKFDLRYFRARMPKNRWLILQQAFHLARNPIVGHPVPRDPLFKIRPLLDLFHKNMKAVQVPAKNLCIDESIVSWRGRFACHQYVSNKKLYLLLEPDGLIHRFLIYTGGSADKVAWDTQLARKVVLRLMSGLLDEGRSVYMDNNYTSVDLVSYLLGRRTHVTGTLRVTRKNNPRDVSSVKLKKGEVAQWWSSNGINVTKWKEYSDVLIVSSEFPGHLVNVPGRGRKAGARKPQMLVEFGKNMRGIDRINQFLSYYSVPRRTLRWYKKLSFHIFELMLLNCYILYRRSSGSRKVDLHDFRLAIVDHLCGITERPIGSILIASPSIINRTHFPRIPDIPEGKSRRKQRRCRNCSKLNILTYTTIYCPGCPENPGLCVNDCFMSYHRAKGFHFM